MDPLSPITRRRWLAAAAALTTTPLATSLAHAQAWPTRPLRILIGAPPGGTADLVARLLAEGLQKDVGQPVIVDAKPGAAGLIAMQEFLGQPADGHTLLVSVNALVTEIPHVLKLRFDPFRDVVPLADLSRSGLVLVANPAVPAKTVAELVAHAKTQPGKLAYASYSAGTISHTMGLALNKAAGIELNHVPYKGSPPALQDVMGGHVALMFDGPATSIPMIRAGKLRALAVSGTRRNPALPDVPTFAEQGYKDDVYMTTAPYYLMAPARTPDAIVERLGKEVALVVRQPEVQERMEGLGLEPMGDTPAEATALYKDALPKLIKLARDTGVTVD